MEAEEIKIHPHCPIHRNLKRIALPFLSNNTTTGNIEDNWND